MNNLEGWGGCKGRREALEEGDIYKLMAHSCGLTVPAARPIPTRFTDAVDSAGGVCVPLHPSTSSKDQMKQKAPGEAALSLILGSTEPEMCPMED